jgi:4-amino-4-deoxy-L-arabinose transferase-like glycosyltransferase
MAGLGDREFLGFESRFGLFAREMLERGVSFFPTLYGAPYPDYPAAQTVLMVLASFPLRGANIFAAVLPSALAAAWTLSLTYLIGSLHSRAWGVLAVLFELCTFGFLAAARTTSLDQFLVAFTTLGFYLAWKDASKGGKINWPLVALALVGGFAFRGPVGLVLPSLVVAGSLACLGDLKKALLAALMAAFLLAACMTALLLAAHREGGEPFVREVIRMQFAGRLASERGHPFHYYLVGGLAAYAVSFPAALLVAAARAKSLFSRLPRPAPMDGRILLALLAWIFAILFVLSVPAVKKMRYLLPVVPGASLLAASIFISRGDGCCVPLLRRALVKIGAAAPGASLAALAALTLTSAWEGLGLPEPGVAILFLLGLEVVAAAMISLRPAATPWRDGALLACGAAALWTLQVFLVEPLQLSREGARPFVQAVERARRPDEILVFYKIFRDSEDVKYAVNADGWIRPEFVASPEEVSSFARPAYFVCEKDDFQRLPEPIARKLEVLAAGRLGHEDCVAFRRLGEPVR